MQAHLVVGVAQRKLLGKRDYGKLRPARMAMTEEIAVFPDFEGRDLLEGPICLRCGP